MNSQRTISECPHRMELTSAEDSSRSDAACGLLMRIIGTKDAALTGVEQRACQACCQSFKPTETDWNPVIASHVFEATSKILQQNRVDKCLQKQAQQLQARALDQLPVVNNDEDDCVDDLQRFIKPSDVHLEDLQMRLPPPIRSTSAVKWAVGVTTAPRRQSTLQRCLQSLFESGWTSVDLYVDGGVSVCSNDRVQIHRFGETPMGAWPAWIASLRDLAEQDCNWVLIAQDDALFPHLCCLRQYIDEMLWPSAERTVISLYTSADDMQPHNLWRRYPNRWRYGALALVFPRQLAIELVASAERGELDVVEGTAGIDARLGVWLERKQISIWHPSPSLVQHIGQISSVWKTSRAVGLRRASRFIADEF